MAWRGGHRGPLPVGRLGGGGSLELLRGGPQGLGHVPELGSVDVGQPALDPRHGLDADLRLGGQLLLHPRQTIAQRPDVLRDDLVLMNLVVLRHALRLPLTLPGGRVRVPVKAPGAAVPSTVAIVEAPLFVVQRLRVDPAGKPVPVLEISQPLAQRP